MEIEGSCLCDICFETSSTLYSKGSKRDVKLYINMETRQLIWITWRIIVSINVIRKFQTPNVNHCDGRASIAYDSPNFNIMWALLDYFIRKQPPRPIAVRRGGVPSWKLTSFRWYSTSWKIGICSRNRHTFIGEQIYLHGKSLFKDWNQLTKGKFLPPSSFGRISAIIDFELKILWNVWWFQPTTKTSIIY